MEAAVRLGALPDVAGPCASSFPVTEWPGEKTLDLVGTAIAYRPFVEVARREWLLVSDVLHHLTGRVLDCLPGFTACLTHRLEALSGQAKTTARRPFELEVLGCLSLA